MTIGILIILATFFGFISNYLNWKFLNYKLTRYLYYIGAFVHETSHAILCILTGAKIVEYKVFSTEPHVTHNKSKLGIIGQAIISAAPIFGGILFLFSLDYFFPSINLKILGATTDWKEIMYLPFKLLMGLNVFSWQGALMLLLFINAGAMIGPSLQDLKNAWPVFILLIFVDISSLNNIGFTALIIILANIYIQVALMLLISIFKKISNK